MNDALPNQRSANPFRAQCLRPGAIPFRFPPGESAASLVDQLRTRQWRGAIVGPHGSGKSTLLASLMPEFAARGLAVVTFELHDGQRRLPKSLRAAGAATGTIVVVDGYEQLSRWSRLRLAWECRRIGCGLLVTAHHPVGLPTLCETRTDVDMAEAVVREIAGESLATSGITTADIREAFLSHNGNIRELLFRMYDLYRQRQVQHRD